MHKFVLKCFELLREFVQFLQIVALICIIFLILYWIQNIIGASWAWLAFVAPLLKVFVSFGENISDGSITLWNANFEFKYFIATVLMFIIFYFFKFINSIVNFCQETYCDGRRQVKKVNEMVFNKNLESGIRKTQQKVNRYQIYVTTKLNENNVNKSEATTILLEENKKMNKFLIEKTGIVPAVVRNGFIYSFNDFDQIDTILEIFFKVIQVREHLDYYTCVYLTDNSTNSPTNLEKLSDLNFKNKIITLSDVILRYKYNEKSKYDVSITGVFQKGNESYEVYQFVEKDK